MIGPGWMPSRPRPLARVRRGLLLYSHARRRRARRPRRDSSHVTYAPALDCAAVPIELPTATLHAASQGRHRLLAGALQRWLVDRWLWLRPRSVPMLVAFAAMLAMLGAMKQWAAYVGCDDATRIRVEDTRAAIAAGDRGRRPAPYQRTIVLHSASTATAPHVAGAAADPHVQRARPAALPH
jgi:hypothetical protein